jgi:uncharacterized membrane protein YeaQ/YmgE (transglycosylase-associated protein family)
MWNIDAALSDICSIDSSHCIFTTIVSYELLRGQTQREGNPMQARIWIGILIGSTVGGFIPDFWGADLFSYSSVLLSGIGAFVGLLIGYKLT